MERLAYPFGDWQLFKVGRYEAPQNRRPRPIRIEKGQCCMEILLGGHVTAADMDGVERSFGRGTVFFHPPGGQTVHRSDLDDPYRCLTLYFSCGALLRPPLPPIFPWFEIDQLDGFSDRVLQDFFHRPADRDLLTHRILVEVWWQARLGAVQTRELLRPDVLKRALHLIENQIERFNTVGALARETGCSTPTLQRHFKDHLQLTPAEALRQRRLREARYLLASTSLTVKQVAFSAGFRSPEAFCRIFKNDAGLSPGAYRTHVHRGSSHFAKTEDFAGKTLDSPSYRP